jgi:flagellar protein FliL
MSAAMTTADGAGSGAPIKKPGRTKLLLLAIPAVLIVAGVGAWLAGILPGMGDAKRDQAAAEQKAALAHPAPVFVELPEMVANLNAGTRRTSFVKVQARIELSKPEDVAAFTAAQPRVIDLFQTYLREMRPEELRGSAGTYRLREELIARASLAIAPARVVDVLFTELLVQ